MMTISITERTCEICVVIITYGCAIKITAILWLRILHWHDDTFREISQDVLIR